MSAEQTDPISPAIIQRLCDRIELLSSISEDQHQLTRPFLSPSMRSVNRVVSSWMSDAGGAVWEDALGNLHGRWESDKAGAKTLYMGSHLDTVRNAGKYDGPLGFLMALSVVEACVEQSIALPFAIEIIAFSDEEGLRFQTAYLGSSFIAGTLDEKILDKKDAQGKTIAEAIEDWGYDAAEAIRTMRPPENALGYIEAHIEQGPVLEGLDVPAGVVAAIAAQKRLRIRWTGKADHAGTTPMDLRQDALAGAAELVSVIEKTGQRIDRLRATVGSLLVEPGASNVIPSAVIMTLDIRHPNDEILEEATDFLHGQAMEIARIRGLSMSWDYMMQTAAVQMDDSLSACLGEAVKTHQDQAPFLFSGAGHDAAAMSAAMPVAMLFVRCREGLSHNPDEYVERSDCEAATKILFQAINNLRTSG